MSKPRRVFAVLLGLAGMLAAPAKADPPPPLPAPGTVSPAPPFAPNAASVAALPLSPGQQKAARMEAQRLAIHLQAQAAEREATRQARARQFDRAQALYGHAASLYHQQARLARRAAQEMAHAGQMSLAARAHAEALAADNRYLACLASEVSVLKKSSLADPLPPKQALPAKPKKPVRILTQAALPPPVPKPVPAHLPAKLLPRPVAARPALPRIALLPPPAPKPRRQTAGAQSASRLLHAARARKALPSALRALRQAAVRPLSFAPGFIAAQQHGLLQERQRLRRAQLQGISSEDAAPPAPALPAPP